MSGHSKWSKVKHQKAVTDVVKGAAFTKASRAITVAVAEGGGATDPDHNFRLRLAIDQARAVNMPKDTIARAIERGGGRDASLQSVRYEGYGPGGVAVLVEAATDNKNRTVSQVKQVFERYHGSIATPGAVAFLFEPAGVILIEKKGTTYDTIFEKAVEAGASDIAEKDTVFEVYAKPELLESVSNKLKNLGLSIENAELIMKPTRTIPLTEDNARTIEKLTDDLAALDDVQQTYDNAA
jgi:YebC/PmpR family DNA-binding regulatory protein